MGSHLWKRKTASQCVLVFFSIMVQPMCLYISPKWQPTLFRKSLCCSITLHGACYFGAPQIFNGCVLFLEPKSSMDVCFFLSQIFNGCMLTNLPNVWTCASLFFFFLAMVCLGSKIKLNRACWSCCWKRRLIVLVQSSRQFIVFYGMW